MEYYRKLAPYYADLHRMKYRYKNPKFNTEMATVGRIMDECIEASRLLDCTATVDKGLKLYEKLNIEPVQTILVGASTSQPLDSPNTGIIAKLESEFRR